MFVGCLFGKVWCIGDGVVKKCRRYTLKERELWSDERAIIHNRNTGVLKLALLIASVIGRTGSTSA